MTIATIAKLGTAALLIGGTMNAFAAKSSHAEIRGYSRCVQTTTKDSHGLVAARDYLIHKTERGNEYFINASRWESGKRAEVRINCETSRNGRRLLSLNIESGRYIDKEGRVRIDVASN